MVQWKFHAKVFVGLVGQSCVVQKLSGSSDMNENKKSSNCNVRISID